jgi:hypothetical protein
MKITASRLVRPALALALCAATPWAEAQTETPTQTQAQPCAERALVVERLESRFGETRQSRGLNGANGLVEIYVSAETGTWTILVTTADGKSCLLASGNVWEQAIPILGKAKDA